MWLKKPLLFLVIAPRGGICLNPSFKLCLTPTYTVPVHTQASSTSGGEPLAHVLQWALLPWKLYRVHYPFLSHFALLFLVLLIWFGNLGPTPWLIPPFALSCSAGSPGLENRVHLGSQTTVSFSFVLPLLQEKAPHIPTQGLGRIHNSEPEDPETGHLAINFGLIYHQREWLPLQALTHQ